MPRPAVDVVMPFAGSAPAFDAARARLARLRLAEGDTAIIADNRPGGDAGGRPGSYFARNRGAERGRNPWIVFLDADVEPPPDLLDRYFAEEPAERTAVLVGAVADEPVSQGAPLAPRWAAHVGLMSQRRTLDRGQWAYAQTANCAVRREAFEGVGGFVEDVRSGGDADLCFRIRAAGWDIEERPHAEVTHSSRRSARSQLRQRVRVGSGAAWLEARYPGFAAPRPLWRVVAGTARELARSAAEARHAGREEAKLRAFSALAGLAFYIGWRVPNRPGRRR